VAKLVRIPNDVDRANLIACDLERHRLDPIGRAKDEPGQPLASILLGIGLINLYNRINAATRSQTGPWVEQYIG
jgi:hypothetical protein